MKNIFPKKISLVQKLLLLVAIIITFYVGFLVFISSVFNFTNFAGSKSPEDLRKTYKTYKNELKVTAEEFLEQKAIEDLTINIDNDKRCELINYWRRCDENSPWEKYDNGKTHYLDSIDEILEKENISKKEFEKYTTILKKYGVRSISKVGYQCQTVCVEFEYLLDGIRYQADGGNLEEDHEYLMVEELEEGWYLYRVDWN